MEPKEVVESITLRLRILEVHDLESQPGKRLQRKIFVVLLSSRRQMLEYYLNTGSYTFCHIFCIRHSTKWTSFAKELKNQIP